MESKKEEVKSEKKEFGWDLPRLPDSVLWHVQRGDGYLDLKMRDKARSEFERIPAPYKNCDLFLEAELRLAMEDGRWSDAATVARKLKERCPSEPVFSIHGDADQTSNKRIAETAFIVIEMS